MTYGIPTDDGETVSAVFGRARSFAICDPGTKALAIVPNEGANSEHGAGTGAAAFLAEKGIEVVVAPEVGPKALEALRAAGIRVVSVPAGLDLDKAIEKADPSAS